MTTLELHHCPKCLFRKTRKPLCEKCARAEAAKARAAAKRRAVPGTVANLGAVAFLAQLVTPDGFTRSNTVDRWPNEPDYPTVVFTGHADATTIRIVIRHVDDEYAPGDGHTEFTTSKGSFSYDRHGVEDSFYVHAEDTAAVVDATVRDQIAKVIAARDRHLTSVTVPFVGHVITPERKAEIQAKLQSGGVHNFMPSGFGTGYRVSIKRASAGRWGKAAPQAMADFFAVPALYYEEMDCD